MSVLNETRTYGTDVLMRLAKRVNNPKRSYLLVNPLQGKHIPIPPDEALAMMQALGRTAKEKFVGQPLVIGFSETATAIGAVVAQEISGQCVYLQTTREKDEMVNKWVYFSEEHSHATEQKLCGDYLDERISDSDYVLLVDDEISTGKTILNIVSAIRKACPAAMGKKFVVASLINRVDKEAIKAFDDQGISFVFLLHLGSEDYEEKVRNFTVHEASDPYTSDNSTDDPNVNNLATTIRSAHRGVVIEEYAEECQKAIAEILHAVDISDADSVLILGTEEFMYPALQLGYQLQKLSIGRSVMFHATTRSPIGIGTDNGYPITNGIRLHSMYEKDRVTYLYNLCRYDKAIVFSDSHRFVREAVIDLQRGLEEQYCSKVYFFYSCRHV